MLHTLLFCSILIGAIFVCIDLSSDEAEAFAGLNTIVTLKMNDAYGYVSVKPGSAPTTAFIGFVIVSDDIGSGRIDINLKARTNHPRFLAAVLPMMISLDPPFKNPSEIRLDVTAPPRANYTDTYDHDPVMVTVEGEWMASPSGLTGQIENTTVMVTVNQFYDLSVSVDPPFFKDWPGTYKTFNIWVKNMGNGVDSFEVSVVNDEFYADMGFQFHADTWEIDIGANQEGKVRLTVYSPQTFSVYESSVYAITIKIVSKGSKRYENALNPRYTIYDIVFHAKGPGMFLYFTIECWAVIILGLALLIVGLYNLLIYRKGKKRGDKYPVRDHWKDRSDRWKAMRKRRKEKAKIRKAERGKKDAVKKAQKDELMRAREADKKRAKAEKK